MNLLLKTYTKIRNNCGKTINQIAILSFEWYDYFL